MKKIVLLVYSGCFVLDVLYYLFRLRVTEDMELLNTLILDHNTR